MKRVLFIIMFLAAAGSVFAQLIIRGSMDTLFVPFQLVQRELVNAGGETVHKAAVGMGLGRLSNNDQSVQFQILMEGKHQDVVGFRVELQAMGVGNTKTWATNKPGTNSTATGTGVVSAASGVFMGFGQNAEVWYQPFHFLKFDVGSFVVNDIRGRIGDTWSSKFTVGCYDYDEIFSDFCAWGYGNGNWGDNRSDFGVLTSFKWSNFSAYLLFPGLIPTDSRTGQWFRPNNANPGGGYPTNNPIEVLGPAGDREGKGEFLRTMERTQFALGYTIPNIGVARVQYIGAYFSAGVAGQIGDSNLMWYEDPNFCSPRFEAAFQLTAVNKLTLDIGGKLFIPWEAYKVEEWDENELEWTNYTHSKDKGKFQRPYYLSLGAVYNLQQITITGRFDGKFGGTYDFQDPARANNAIVKLPTQLNFHLWPQYNAGFAVLGLDFGLEYLGDKTQGDVTHIKGGVRVGGGVTLEKRWGGAHIRTGLLFRAPNYMGGNDKAGAEKVESTREDMVLSLPVWFEFRF